MPSRRVIIFCALLSLTITVAFPFATAFLRPFERDDSALAAVDDIQSIRDPMQSALGWIWVADTLIDGRGLGWSLRCFGYLTREPTPRARPAGAPRRLDRFDLPPNASMMFAFHVRAGWPLTAFEGVAIIDHSQGPSMEVATQGVLMIPGGSTRGTSSVSTNGGGGPPFVDRDAHALAAGYLRPVPLRPRPLGLVVNSALTFVVLVTLFAAPRTLVRSARRRRGRCTACGHQLHGDQSQCPECGGTDHRRNQA